MNAEVMSKIISFRKAEKMLFNEARRIREIVFIKEQKVSEEEEFDAFENESKHYLIYQNGNPVGTARWRFIGEKIKLERFAVLKSFRSKGVGNALLDKVLEDVLPFKKAVYLHAQLPALSFYERCGFLKEGAKFMECDIEHYKMSFYNRNIKEQTDD